MPVDTRWREVSEETWTYLVDGWLAELDNSKDDGPCDDSQPDYVDGSTKDEEDFGDIIVRMNFMADSYLQWKFIELAMQKANDNALGHIAAGPIEHILGWHGEDYIAKVEDMVRSDPKWRLMIKTVLQYLMTDSIWARVQALKNLDT